MRADRDGAVTTTMDRGDEPSIPLNGTCPVCGRHANTGDMFDGERKSCGSCGRMLVAVVWADDWDRDTMSLVAVGPGDTRTGRQRTRARWRKQGRR